MPGAKIQMPNTYLSQFGELVDVEELEHPPLSKGQDTQTTSLVDEFLDKDSQIRSFFFPDKRNAIDPGEGSDRN